MHDNTLASMELSFYESTKENHLFAMLPQEALVILHNF